MINKLEIKEKFWSNKVSELSTKLLEYGKSAHLLLNEEIKPTTQDASYEELRLIHDLSQEELAEVKSLLHEEKNRNEKLNRTIESSKSELLRLESFKRTITGSLSEKIGLSRQLSLRDWQVEFEKKIIEIKEGNERIQRLESDLANEKEEHDWNLKKLQERLDKSNIDVKEAHEELIKLKKHYAMNEQECLNSKNELQRCMVKIKELEAQIEFLSQKKTSVSMNDSKASELKEKFKLLEDENLNLREQIEIYQEDQKKKITENGLFQKLSYMILSKDKTTLDPEISHMLRRTIGEHPTKLIETFQEKSFTLEQENKILMQKLSQENQSRIECLEKLKTLQEYVNKMLGDQSFDNEIHKTKMQIIAAKNFQVNSIGNEKIEASPIDLYELQVELEVLRDENRILKLEKEKTKEEANRSVMVIQDLENKLRFYETMPDKTDVICFIQCEAAALEDMLAESDSPELDSEDLY